MNEFLKIKRINVVDKSTVLRVQLVRLTPGVLHLAKEELETK